MGHLALKSSTLAFCFMAGFGTAATAQETVQEMAQTAGPAIAMELSAAEDLNAQCKLSFVVTNGHKSDVEQAVYETVLFDAAGQVARLTLLDFQDLPAGRPRVRQFQFPQACADISRVLINGAQTCSAPALPKGACSQGLSLTSRVKVELLG
ncbi:MULTISPECIES: hypothetical protein [Pseudophaeobacter]|uniref:hypothetical protein n=1 Tax=Pseudophaeobacter TaxID=1541822 RepID=UPI00242AE2C7|nr:hypothetical protein [Pseudophaeobacter profundi]